MTTPQDSIVPLYERRADDYDRDRGRSLIERRWLERFRALLPHDDATVLDVGCGMGEPIARHLIEAGIRVVGVDAAPSLIAKCRVRFPEQEWLAGDMRTLALGRTFDGVLAWDSLFHLTAADQRAVIPRLASHAKVGAPLMFTTGPAAGESIGEYHGEPLYHASLSPGEYRTLLRDSGCVVRQYCEDDPACGHHTVWLASRATGG